MNPVSVVMNVSVLDSDVRVKGVLVEHDSAAGEIGNVEVFLQLNPFLKSNHVPFSRNVFL